MKNYLNSGGDVKKGETRYVDKLALSNSKNKKVTILLLSKDEKNKIPKYERFSRNHFKRLGAKQIEVILPNTSKRELAAKTKNVDMIFLPGGDSKVLMGNIKRLKLQKFIKRANVILGHSAGAIAQSSGFGVKRKSLIKGLNLLKITIKVHYDSSQDERLLRLSKKRDIYAIPEKSSIVYDKKMKYIGPVWKFSKGTKKKL
jgi:dipeptidase E